MTDWDARFIGLAKHVASFSKDPSTQVGAVIVRPDRSVASIGFNGLPSGVSDVPELLSDREWKYPRIVHAEINSLLFCEGKPRGCTIYTWPMPPCSQCAAAIIQSGIVKVRAPPPGERWRSSCGIGQEMFNQAGVDYRLI